MNRTRNVLRALLPVLILGLSAAASRAIVASRKTPEPSPPEEHLPIVRTVVAQASPVVLRVEAQGSVLPRTETRLMSEVAARVVELSPRLAAGGFFRAGEVLVVLDDTDLELAQEEARARVAQAETRLAQERADAAVARRDWQALGRDEEAPPLVLRVPQLEQASAELAAARAALTKAQRDVERARVRAPYDGRVRSRAVDLGQYVERGTPLATVYAVDYAEVRLPVQDKDLAQLDLGLGPAAGEEGPRVLLEAEFARRRHRWEGRVVRTEGAIDPRTRSVVLVVRIDDPYAPQGEEDPRERPPLLAGMFVQASIEGRHLDAAVVLPRAALRSGGRVFVLGGDARLDIREVTLEGGDEQAVVLAAGVAAGERVIVSPIELPVEGMALRAEATAGEGGR